MREHKFRGYNKKLNRWVYGDYNKSYDGKEYILYIESNDVGDIGTAFCEVEPESVGEYTGLKDKNGKEIYEGDIIKFINRFGVECIEEVFWDNIYGCWQHTYLDRVTKNFMHKYSKIKVEVVGNIYENSDLLKDSDE